MKYVITITNYFQASSFLFAEIIDAVNAFENTRNKEEARWKTTILSIFEKRCISRPKVSKRDSAQIRVDRKITISGTLIKFIKNKRVLTTENI